MGHAYGSEKLQSMVLREIWLNGWRWNTSVFCAVREQQDQRSSSLPHLCRLIFHPNQTSISHFILISQLPQPIIISPVCAFECLLLSFFFPPSSLLIFFPVISFLQQSISLFNLMLFSCLSRLCVWFSFSWRLAGKRAGFYLKIFFLKKKKKKNITMLVFSPGKV